MGVGIFSDCIFFLKVNSLPLKQRTKLKSSITSNGGEISFVLNEKCTHVIVCNPATLNSTQHKKIEKHLISVVHPNFIWESVQEERLNETEYQDSDKPFEVTGDKDEVFSKEKKNLFLDKFLSVNKKKTPERILEEDVTFEDSEELVNVDNIPDDTEVAKYSCFQKGGEYAVVELLCFSREDAFPFKISTVHELPDTSQKECTFQQVDTAAKACEKYEFRVNDVKNKGFTQINRVPLQAENLASKALRKVLLGEANTTELSPEVAGLVETIWVDAVGHLDSILSCPVGNISLNDVSKAEGILCQLRNALIKKDKKGIHQMVQEFYRCIPHKKKIQRDINMKFLTLKQDLCQVIRDMVNVCETNSSGYTATSNAKYQALRCRIDHIDPNSAEFHQVKQDILDNNHSNREFNFLRVFKVGRLSEVTNFKSDVGNVKALLHSSSPCNFVGILSRGLMLPKIIVEEFGGERTDIGNLGSGIYFSDSISTSIKYSQPSDVTGSRLLVVCDVALGKCKDVSYRDYTLTEPPNGFNSMHGVRRKDGVNSDFIDDEYVVYNVNQVQMRYIVQFSTDGDIVDLHKESLFISMDQTPDYCKSLPEPSEEDPSINDLPEHQVTKAGLKGSDGQQIPLQSIHVKARLMDLVAKVVMFQTYKNDSAVPIEAKYVFPLDSTAAVCGFEAFINGKHIIGEVKEKQQAHREYRTAISEGHGAYLMDQDAPDVFTVSVGNLPPKATVVIKITYVMEQEYQYGYTRFSIPGDVAQWQQDKALKENTQDTVTKVGIESDKVAEGPFCLDMSIEMPRKIEKIECYTHKLKIKKTECKAVIQTEESSSLNEYGISVEIYVEDANTPRMWVEKHPDEDSEACMLVFKPDFENIDDDNGYSANIFLTICLDCSNSMESCFYSAKQVALLTLRYLHCNYVNIVLFGSNYKELYSYPKPRQYDSTDGEQFIKEAKPNMGSTEFWKVLQSLCLLRPKMGRQKVVFISDGHVQNENLVVQILKKNHIQLFTCGVGTTTNKHMLKCFAKYGSGAFEYFADNSKDKWIDQMNNHANRLYSPTCTSVSVKWRQFNLNSSEPLQAPKNIQTLFSQDWLLVYGFVPHCTQATLKALIVNKEFENMVSTTELQKTTGTILHTLTARALIKDYEYGILNEKENENEMKKRELKSVIIQLSKEYSLVTPFTSFVAVEKRTAEENLDIEPNVLEIISAEDVDILPYMSWSDLEDEVVSVLRDGEVEGIAAFSYGSPLCFDMLQFEEPMDDIANEETSGEILQSDEVPMALLEVEEPMDDVAYNFATCQPHKAYQKVSEEKEETSGDRLQSDFVQQAFELEAGLDDEIYPTLRKHRSRRSRRRVKSYEVYREPDIPVAAPGELMPALVELDSTSIPLELNQQFSPQSDDLAVERLQKQKMPKIPISNRLEKEVSVSEGISLDGDLGFGFGSAPPPTIQATMFSSTRFSIEPASSGIILSQPPPPPLPGAAPEKQGYKSRIIKCFTQLSSPQTTSFAPISGRLEKEVSVSEGISLDEDLGFGFRSAPPPTIRMAMQPSLAPFNLGSVHPPKPAPGGMFGSAPSGSSLSSEGFSFAQKKHDTKLSASFMKKSHEEVPVSSLSWLPAVQSSSSLFGSATHQYQASFPDWLLRPDELLSYADSPSITFQKKKKSAAILPPPPPTRPFVPPSWTALMALQSQEGYWLLDPELGTLLKINVSYLTEDFLVKKGIASLGARGIDTVHKLIATLLVLQVVRTYNLLSEVKFKTLMKLDLSVPKSSLCPKIEKAISWAVKSDQQYSGICMRLGLGKDWDQATRQLLGLDPVSTTSDLYLYSQCLLLL